MKTLLFFVTALSLVSCSGGHEDVYVFNKQAYTTYHVSEFEVAHFNLFGHSNLLYLEDGSSKDKKGRITKLKALCDSYQMDCQSLNLAEFDSDKALTIVEQFKSYGDKKFLLISPSKEASAQFFGVINLVEQSGDQDSLKTLFKKIGVEDVEATSNQVFEIYTSAQNPKKMKK